MKVAVALSVSLLAGFLPFGAWAKENNFEGTITATEENGGTPIALLYTRKGDLLRIEMPEAKTPVPINVLNLAQQKLIIIYPHNRSFVTVNLKEETQPSLANSLSTPTPNTSVRPEPAISPPPGFPQPPPMPSMPPMPNSSNMPNNPMAPGMPMMPSMRMGTKLELKKTDKTRKVQGFDCALYTLSDRGQRMEIWATPDEALFPFRKLETNHLRRRFGPEMLEEQWMELLQNKSLFPLEATLRMDLPPQPASPAADGAKGNDSTSTEHGEGRPWFKVDKIEKKKIENEALFKPPEGYQEIQAPQF